jgi:hypothetical protein
VAIRLSRRSSVNAWKAAAAALLLTLAGCNASPEDRAQRVLASMEAQEPIFALLREREPDAYGEMRALIEQSERQGQRLNSLEMIQRVRMILIRTIMRRTRTAPDAISQEFATFVADQAKALEPHPQVCADLLFARAGDVESYISQEMKQREQRLYEDLLNAPVGAPGEEASLADAEQLLEALIAEAPASLGMNENQVAEALEGKGPPINICRFNERLMRHVSQMPTAQSARMFRLLNRLANEELQPAARGQRAGPPAGS